VLSRDRLSCDLFCPAPFDHPIDPTRTTAFRLDEIVLVEFPEIVGERPFRARVVDSRLVPGVQFLWRQRTVVVENIVDDAHSM